MASQPRASRGSQPAVLALIGVLLTFAALLPTVHAQGCSGDLFQVCNVTLHIVDCRDRNLTVMPCGFDKLDFQSITTVWLQNNQITSLPASSFGGAEKDVTLGLIIASNNAIEEIDPDAFVGVGDLGFLDLSNNLITRLPEGVFREQSVIKNLFLNDNLLESLGTTPLFDHLPLLEKISLHRNRLTAIHSANFNNTQLKFLNLYENKIASLEPSSFPPSVQQIELDNNELTHIASRTFVNLPNVTGINLGYNRISSFDSDAIVNLPRLLRLLLPSNNFTVVTRGMFKGVGNYLDLSFNQITCVAVGSFKNNSLRYLDLSSNAITTLQDDVFEGLTRADAMALSTNNIQYIADSAFRGLDRLVTLQMDWNPSICDVNKFASGDVGVSCSCATGTPASGLCPTPYLCASEACRIGPDCEILPVPTAAPEGNKSGGGGILPIIAGAAGGGVVLIIVVVVLVRRRRKARTVVHERAGREMHYRNPIMSLNPLHPAAQSTRASDEVDLFRTHSDPNYPGLGMGNRRYVPAVSATRGSAQPLSSFPESPGAAPIAVKGPLVNNFYTSAEKSPYYSSAEKGDGSVLYGSVGSGGAEDKYTPLATGHRRHGEDDESVSYEAIGAVAGGGARSTVNTTYEEPVIAARGAEAAYLEPSSPYAQPGQSQFPQVQAKAALHAYAQASGGAAYELADSSTTPAVKAFPAGTGYAEVSAAAKASDYSSLKGDRARYISSTSGAGSGKDYSDLSNPHKPYIPSVSGASPSAAASGNTYATAAEAQRFAQTGSSNSKAKASVSATGPEHPYSSLGGERTPYVSSLGGSGYAQIPERAISGDDTYARAGAVLDVAAGLSEFGGSAGYAQFGKSANLPPPPAEMLEEVADPNGGYLQVGDEPTVSVVDEARFMPEE